MIEQIVTNSLESQLILFLSTEKGYKECPTYAPNYPEIAHRLFYKQANTNINCSSNEKPPQIIVEYFSYIIQNKEAHNITISLRAADKTDTWYSLEAYSLHFNELKEKIDTIEQSLVKLWETLNS